MHWCADETNALMAALPLLGGVIVWLKVKWARRPRKGNRA